MTKPMTTIKRKAAANIMYLRLRVLFFILPIMFKVSPPSKKQCEEMLVAIEGLKIKLGVE
jgi:hypothetical protein